MPPKKKKKSRAKKSSSSAPRPAPAASSSSTSSDSVAARLEAHIKLQADAAMERVIAHANAQPSTSTSFKDNLERKIKAEIKRNPHLHLELRIVRGDPEEKPAASLPSPPTTALTLNQKLQRKYTAEVELIRRALVKNRNGQADLQGKLDLIDGTVKQIERHQRAVCSLYTKKCQSIEDVINMENKDAEALSDSKNIRMFGNTEMKQLELLEGAMERRIARLEQFVQKLKKTELAWKNGQVVEEDKENDGEEQLNRDEEGISLDDIRAALLEIAEAADVLE